MMTIPRNGISLALVTLFTGAAVQAMKVVVGTIQDFKKNRQFSLGKNLQRITEPGGMPSSHSASVTTLFLLTGFWFGFKSPFFGIALFFGLIVIYDAAGVRRAVGKQATLLNIIIEEFEITGHPKSGRFRELIGHTPFEVFVGAIIGALLAIIFWRI
ncbi:MAG: hypothetical protein APR63_06940 [Desulfuromonas sp. SDB]|nr:MAG: hypothetical protein APR63_06940 [Desulfuromonas sp. SDB]